MSGETEHSSSDETQIVLRLIDVVQNLANEYQILAKTIGGDRRVPPKLRKAALERAREILEKLPDAIEYATGVERKPRGE